MIGEKLGKYTILETVGSGSMGTVYKAEDPEGQLVALKLVRSQILYDIDKRERFLQGILAASEIRHKGICSILEIGDDNDDFFVVMPFLNGRTLKQLMERRPLPLRQALDIAIAVGAALSAVHEAGAVHRGLKPANIWVLNEHAVVISDCCLARFTEAAKGGKARPFESHAAHADTIIPPAALAYMSPEQVRGKAVDWRSDIFSFGVILYEMLSGRHPFAAKNSHSRMHAILEANPPAFTFKQVVFHPKLRSFFCKALAKAPENRYPSVKEMMADFAVILESTSPRSLCEQGSFGLRMLLLSRALALASILLIVLALLIFSLSKM